MFSDNYFELGSASVDPANVPLSIPLWPDHGLASDASRLPRHINGYGTLNDVSRERTSIWSGDPRPGSARQAYQPMPADSYPFRSLDHGEDRNGQWGTPDYSSYFTDYPTPQSDISGPSPPPALNDMTPFSLYNSGTGMMYVPDTTSSMQQDPRGFMNAGGSCPRLPQIPEMPSPDECRSPYRQGQRDWYSIEGNESDGDDSISGEPYAQLIARALRSAPEHKMVLKEIYRWFEKNTNKAKGNSKGWQNSIRHNLSMNGGFRKVDQDPPTDDSKRGFIWVLEESAYHEGVKSTTRYRKSGSNKKVSKARHPAPERQRSGAKGGKAARKAAKIRRSARLDGPSPWKHEDIPIPSIEGPLPDMVDAQPTPSNVWTPDTPASFFGRASRSNTQGSMEHDIYSYGDIAGVTDTIPDGPLFPDHCHEMSTAENGMLANKLSQHLQVN
ncbi:MAG: hypothetical protein Q9183_001751 [Haloplaca sp. 2 TL-2023]